MTKVNSGIPWLALVPSYVGGCINVGRFGGADLLDFWLGTNNVVGRQMDGCETRSDLYITCQGLTYQKWDIESAIDTLGAWYEKNK